MKPLYTLEYLAQRRYQGAQIKPKVAEPKYQPPEDLGSKSSYESHIHQAIKKFRPSIIKSKE